MKKKSVNMIFYENGGRKACVKLAFRPCLYITVTKQHAKSTGKSFFLFFVLCVQVSFFP